jgi:hypothetical protein
MTWRDRRRRVPGALACVLIVVVVEASPPRAVAADTDEAAARALFAEARRLAAAGDYADACPKFEASFRLNPGIGTNFNLADCMEHTGRIATAWARFLDVAAATRLAGQPEREQVARDRAAALEPRLAHLTVRVAAPAPGLMIARDDVDLPPSSWDMAVPIDPGPHAIKANAPGRQPWSTTVDVPDAGAVSVSVPPLAALPEPPAAIVTIGPSPQAGPSLQRHVSTPVVAAASVALVGLVAGAYFGVQFQRENSEAKGLCDVRECSTGDELNRHNALVTDALQDRTRAFVAAGIGVAAVGAAGLLWWRSGRMAALSARSPVSVQAALGTFRFDW